MEGKIQIQKQNKNQDVDEDENNHPAGEVGEVVKVTITKKAERAMSELLPRINEGFDGGKINRQDLVSWILMRAAGGFGDAEIREIRADHVDEITLLELCLRRSRQTGKLSPELKKLLLSQAGFDEGAKKPSRKPLTDKLINE